MKKGHKSRVRTETQRAAFWELSRKHKRRSRSLTKNMKAALQACANRLVLDMFSTVLSVSFSINIDALQKTILAQMGFAAASEEQSL